MKRMVSILISICMMIAMLSGCGLGVQRPEIETGEFNFSVTYEFDGEVQTVSGVYVCEYNGVDWALDGGAHRDWSGYIKDADTDGVFHVGTTAEGGKVELQLGFYPEYFMNDPETGGKEIPVPYLSVVIQDGEGMSILHEPEDVEEYCGAKIIRYEFDEPVENSFR